jgi:hypothetical protein
MENRMNKKIGRNGIKSFIVLNNLDKIQTTIPILKVRRPPYFFNMILMLTRLIFPLLAIPPGEPIVVPPGFCHECHIPLSPDPNPKDLFIYLHAWRYTTENLGEWSTPL